MPNDTATKLPALVPQQHAMPMDAMQRLAESVAKSGLFGIRTPDQALVLMSIAQAEGRHPALAARDYHIIQGAPAKKAEAMARDFLGGGGRIEWHQLDDEAADATFSHPAGGSVRIRWDQARVTKAGLGSNPMHKKYPRQMLRSRTVSEGVRTVWPTATSGFYVPEEVAEFGPGQAEPIDVTPKADLDQFAAAEDRLRLAAEGAAADGVDAFRDFWRRADPEQRAALKSDIAEYQRVALDADARRAMAGDDDPFGLPPHAPQSPQASELPAPSPEQAISAPQDGGADLLGDPPAEDLTVPLGRNPSRGDLEYWARQVHQMIDEKPATKQRLAMIRSANESGLRQLKAALVDEYDALQRTLAGNG